jgi:hypothetical protein
MEANREAYLQTLRQFGQSMLFWIALVIFLAYLLGIFSPSKTTIFCDAETVGQFQKQTVFLDRKHVITGGHLQSRAYALSGQHSIRLSPEDEFGFKYVVPKLKGNERIQVSVWRYAHEKKATPGVIIGNVKGIFWKDCEKVVETQNGWEKIECTLDPTFSCRGKDLEIYCWNRGDYPIYFDDMQVKIERVYN